MKTEEKKPRIVIIVEGGVVQDVLADSPVECVIIDYDCMGVDEGTRMIPQPASPDERAHVTQFDVMVRPERVATLFEAATKEDVCP